MMRGEDLPTTVHPLAVPEIVTLPQEIDVHNAPRVGHELISALGERTTVLIADMSLTEFCDSSGIRQLLTADKTATIRGAELRVVVQSRAVLKVMRTLGVNNVLKIYDSMSAALSRTPLPSPQSPF